MSITTSITTEIRGYADTAIEQGKQVLDQAQAQFSEVAGQISENANEFVAKITGGARESLTGLTGKLAGNAGEAVQDLREQAEKALNLEALRSAVEPYLAQAKGYGATLTERAEELLEGVRGDERVAKLLAGVELVNRTVQERVVRPVRSLTGQLDRRGGKQAAKPAARKPAATRPATAKPAATASGAPTKAAAKPATKRAGTPAAKSTTRPAPSAGAKTTRPRKATTAQPKSENG